MESQNHVKKVRVGATANRAPKSRGRAYPIIVHSHLGWDWVWQRPQQFLSRFAKEHRILFVEGPVPEETISEPRKVLREVPGYPNIMVLQMAMPASRWNDGEWVDSQRRRLVREGLRGTLAPAFEDPVQWFYDPMAVTAFAGKMGEIAIVYDCMDQLSQFRGAPPELVRRERELLTLADVVFAGGPKIHSAKKRYNANCHSYGCGVDVKHFSKARHEATEIPEEIRDLRGPILGFFGVVDERMDYDLLARMAKIHPEWQIVMVGPRTKVEEWVLPKAPNIHWLGGRDYNLLPHYAKAFDVCLMPFAINEATEYINPTKALEYMATGRPIVSSAIEDVVLQFNGEVLIATDHAEYIRMCEKALSQPDQARIQRGIKKAEANTWEAIVGRLKGHIEDVLIAKERDLEEGAA